MNYNLGHSPNSLKKWKRDYAQTRLKMAQRLDCWPALWAGRAKASVTLYINGLKSPFWSILHRCHKVVPKSHSDSRIANVRRQIWIERKKLPHGVLSGAPGSEIEPNLKPKRNLENVRKLWPRGKPVWIGVIRPSGLLDAPGVSRRSFLSFDEHRSWNCWP